MTATVTNLPNPAANPPTGHHVAAGYTVGDGLDWTSEEDRRQATVWVNADLYQAARLLYTAAATARRGGVEDELADRVDRVRADLLAVIAGEDTPSEIEFGDLAADASASADEVEKLREELEEARGETREYGKGN
jgi:hypothetical protein